MTPTHVSEPTVFDSERSEQQIRDGQFYRERAKEFIELHDQVQTSVNLLDSLEHFLSTFQKDLSAVSGQISELQDRSKEIDSRLKSRRKIEKPLSSLISELTIPPPLATLILDSNVGEHWLDALPDFEVRLETTRAKSRVKAARDLGEVAEGLRIVAATKLRGFFLSLFQPIKGSVTTNMQVIQTSVLLKYRSLFGFLQRQAPVVAQEVQRTYVAAARVYYETGFRRYARSLGWIKARITEKAETIVAGAGTNGPKDLEMNTAINLTRLVYAKIEGPGVTLAYMADDKAHKEPLEALFRSLILVLMDNATAEYTFVTTFFNVEPIALPPPASATASLFSPMDTGMLTPERASFRQPSGGSEYGGYAPRPRADSMASTTSIMTARKIPATKDEQAALDVIWKQIMDPVLEYTQVFVRSVVEPAPPAIPLLTMIRLAEDVIEETQKRGCGPLESYIFGLRLQMWPVFQKTMTDNVDALKKVAEGTSTGYFARAAATTDALVISICQRYIIIFNSFVTLTTQAEETMIFSNLIRMRQELLKLLTRHTDGIVDPVSKATAQSTLYERILQGFSKGNHITTHPKSQQETAFWIEKEAEARRRIATRR